MMDYTRSRFHKTFFQIPAHIIQLEVGVSAIAWSPSRPLVFSASADKNQVLIFDLRQSKTGATVELKASEKLIPFPLTTIGYNRKNVSLLATGDGFGRLHVWSLTKDLTSMKADETKQLDNFSDIKEE